jgi:uncharacterized protein
MAKMGTCISGSLLIKDCARLTEALYDNMGEIQVELKFGVDAYNYKYMYGEIDAKLHISCQRCLKSMNININSTFNFSPVQNEEAARLLPKHYEPLLVSEKEINLNDLIEDEVLLSLPLVAMHAKNECEVTLSDFNKKLKQDVSTDEIKENVFRKLNVLKDSKH